MSKKSIVFLVFAIIFFVLAVGIFIYANTLNKDTNENQENNNNQNNIETNENKPEGFVFYDENGNEFGISNYEGTPIALILWSSDTENSFEVVEMIESVYNDYKNDITFLVINTEEKSASIVQTVENCNYSFQVYYDTENLASDYYEYSKLPTLIFLEADGTKSNQIEGTITEDSLLANLDLIAENY